VSTMSRLVPSPDWFVGVDSLDLCLKGRWRDRVTVDADPLDAGTDQGLTFTAPRWASQPAANISRISSRWPTHPAASFYYPELERLPRIGYFQFRKLREYALVLERARQDSETRSNFILRYNACPATRVACLVSDWSSWSPCSQSCGLGESWRHRQVLQHPRGGARPCPPLRELRWCGSARSCRKPQSYFRW
ncbi:f-spondin, putative, partial [Ixodes scapularis]